MNTRQAHAKERIPVPTNKPTIKKSALKRVHQDEKKNLRNRAVKTRIKNVVKEVRAAIEAKAPEKAKEALKLATSIIDKGAAKGVIHKNTASRKIARLARQVMGIE